MSKTKTTKVDLTENKNAGLRTVRYRNCFANISLRGLTATQMDILISFFAILKNRNEETVEIDLLQLKKMINYSSSSKKRFVEDVTAVNRKLMCVEIFQITPDEELKNLGGLALFTEYRFSSDYDSVSIRINQPYAFLINDAFSDFTKYRLDDFVSLKSAFAKVLFMQLKRFRNTGFFHFEMERFREIMKVPKSYRMKDIDRRILFPAIKELNDKFADLRMEKIYGVKNGRRAVVAFNFYFTPETEQEALAEKDENYLCSDPDFPDFAGIAVDVPF